jgi:hypothetical protein
MEHTKQQVQSKAAQIRTRYRLGLLSVKEITQYESLPGWRWKESICIRAREFMEARLFASSLCLVSKVEWNAHWKSVKRPIDIPSSPHCVYKGKGWVSWPDWLGCKRSAAHTWEYRLKHRSPQ